MEFNTVSRRTEIAYKAEEMDEVAQQTEVRGCISTVNAAVVQLQFMFLSGEICLTGRPVLQEAHGLETGCVIGQKSAEVIVGLEVVRHLGRLETSSGTAGDGLTRLKDETCMDMQPCRVQDVR